MTTHLTAAMCAASRIIGDPRLSPDGTSVAFVSVSDGRAALVTIDVDGGPEIVVTTEPAPARSTSEGRGVFDWTPDGAALIFVTGTGELRWQPAAGGPGRSLPGTTGGGASSPVVSPDGTRVAYVHRDRHVAVAWIDPSGPWPVRVSGAAEARGSPDFCADPAWSPDGTTVAWHEWDVPAMAWDNSHVALAAAPGPDGGPGSDKPRRIKLRALRDAVGQAVSVAQPRYSPDGSAIGFLCDAGGWLNLWVAEPDGANPRSLVSEQHEHGAPTWGGGQRSWVWSPDAQTVAVCRNEEGFGRLVLFETASGKLSTVGRGVFTGLSWQADRLAAVRSGAATPDQLVAYDMTRLPAGTDPADPDLPPRLALPRRTLARGPVAGFEAGGLIEPQPVRWDGEARPGVGATVHGRLTAASSPPPGLPGTPSPLLVWIHGGPTGQNQVRFNARSAFFVSRGWNVLQVDPRGSTGWGRDYAQALRHEWGRLDTDDVAAGIRAAFAAGWGDPRRTAIMGGSSGGLTVLSVLARYPELCAAGVDLYGVTDLIDLDDTTHRFEAHYQTMLLGPRPEADERYRHRSPLQLADQIVAPLLVLHGSADASVVQGQSDALVAALRSRGATVDYHVYEGEGHGWSRPATVVDELDRIDAFLTYHVLRLPRRPIP